MLSAFGDRHDVMHLLHGSDASFSQTPFADGMASGVPVSNPLPAATVFLVVVRGAGVCVVLSVGKLLMFLAVL